MERLTQERITRTDRWYHAGWYLNITIVVGVLLVAAAFWIIRDEFTSALVLLVLAAVLLGGAGAARHQARLESQHLELKLAIDRLTREVETLAAPKRT